MKEWLKIDGTSFKMIVLIELSWNQHIVHIMTAHLNLIMLDEVHIVHFMKLNISRLLLSKSKDKFGSIMCTISCRLAKMC